LKTFYHKNPEKYKFNLFHIYDLDLRESLAKIVGLDIDWDYDQHEVNKSLTFFANKFYEFSESNEYLISRGVTEDQINRFKLGNVSGFFNHLEKNVDLYDFNEVSKSLMRFYICSMQEVSSLYGPTEMVTIPNFNVDCLGIVGRVVGYTDKYKIDRNIHKFSNTNQLTYLLGEDVLDDYDWVYLVEGVFDLLAMDRIGIKNVVTASATSLSNMHVKKLMGKGVIAIFDNDLGGYHGIERLKNQDIDLIDGVQIDFAKDIDEADPNQLYNWVTSMFL